MTRLAGFGLMVVVHAAWGAAPTPVSSMARCQQAVAESRSIDPRARRMRVQAGCKGLYSQRRCGDAWGDLLENSPPNRWQHLQDWCGDAYCTRLPSPKPAACAPKALASEAAWLELHRAVLQLEGLSPEFASTLAPFFREPNEVPWPTPTVEVRAGKPSVSAVIRAPDGGSQWSVALSNPPDESQLAAFRRALSPLCRGAVKVTAEGSLPMRVIYPLRGTAADAGCDYQELELLDGGSAP